MSTTLVRTAGSDHAITVGKVLAESGFFQDSRGAAQAAVKVMAGAELGFGPVASMTGVNIIKGRVTLSANLMAAAIKRHPNYTYRITEHTAERCAISFIESGEVVGESSFSMDDAKAAGLASGENYKKYPKNMLFSRALSNGAKWYCPDVFGGSPVYTPDELGATVDGETGSVVDGHVVEPPALPAGTEPGTDEPVDADVVIDPLDAEVLKQAASGLTASQIRMVLSSHGIAHGRNLFDHVPDQLVQTVAADLEETERKVKS